jgi:hypothetical protein
MESKQLNNTKADRPSFQVINQSAINQFLWSIRYPNRVYQSDVSFIDVDELRKRQEEEADRHTKRQKKE